MKRLPGVRAAQGVRPSGAPAPTAGAGMPAGRARPRTALVVDDDLMIARLIGRLLERHGWRTLVAGGSEQALRLRRGVALDVLVTDYNMPGMNGLDLASQVWRQQADLPVVIVSGGPEVANLAIGAQLAFVPKPIDLTLLLSRIEAIVARSQAAPSGVVRDLVPCGPIHP